jgi:hypothetical protein
VAVVESDDVTRELDDGDLHAETDAEERQPRLARGANRLDHAFHAAHPKPPGTSTPSKPASNSRAARRIVKRSLEHHAMSTPTSFAMPP